MNSTILIFGAGSGIGDACLQYAAKENENVLGFSRNGNQSENLLSGENFYYCDLTNRSSLIQTTNLINNNVNAIKGIILAAGDGLFKNIQDINEDVLDYHFSLNVTSYILLLKQLFPLIIKSPSLMIVFISSIASLQGFPESVAYCASKHAITGVARALREEWRQYDIRVTNIILGAVATDIWNGRNLFNKDDMLDPKDVAKTVFSLINLPKDIYIDEIKIVPKKGVL